MMLNNSVFSCSCDATLRSKAAMRSSTDISTAAPFLKMSARNQDSNGFGAATSSEKARAEAIGGGWIGLCCQRKVGEGVQ